MAKLPKGIEIVPKVSREAARVLSSDALHFVAELQRGTSATLEQLKLQRAAAIKAGLPDFKPHTSAIRAGAWKAAALPRDLTDLRCGIVTSVSRKPLLAALNSGARLCLADFADSTSPTWNTLIDGHINLMDRWTSAMEHVDKVSGRRVSLSQRLAALMVQPRRLLSDEPRVKCDGKPFSAGLFDAGLYLFHNAKVALTKASGPYLCFIDIASQAEARAWNDILLHAQSLLELPAGAIRLQVRIDTLSAAFEIDEIVHELREHVAGLSLSDQRHGFDVMGLKGLVIRTAHRRGILAMAPMTRDDAKPHAEQAVRSGFDGIWTSSPEQVATAIKVFNGDMPTPNQTYVSRDDVSVTQNDLLKPGDGKVTSESFQQTVRSAILMLEAWLSGRGAITVDAMIEDGASLDLRRAQLWHWLRQGVKLEDGRKITAVMFEECLSEILKPLKSADGRHKEAAALLKAMVTAADLVPDVFVIAWKKLA